MRGNYASTHTPIKGGAMHYSDGLTTRCRIDLTGRDGKPRFTQRFHFERLGYVAPVNITHQADEVTCTRCLRKLIAHNEDVRASRMADVISINKHLDKLRAQLRIRSKVAA